MTKAPKDLVTLRAEIVERHQQLSPRLQQVAAFVVDNPRDMGLETLAVIAQKCDVQPSTIVRFAKAFGYTGASQMQKLFRDEVINAVPSSSYAARVHQFREQAGNGKSPSPLQLMRELAHSDSVVLEQLADKVSGDDLELAVDLMEKSASIYLVGVRRSFPVVVYLAYALRHVDKPIHLVDGLAGMMMEQSATISKKDVLIAVSFRSYAEETAEIVARAHARAAPVISISDSLLSPISRHAAVSFEVGDAEVMQFRSLAASLCLAQTLVISLAQRVDARQARSRKKR